MKDVKFDGELYFSLRFNLNLCDDDIKFYKMFKETENKIGGNFS